MKTHSNMARAKAQLVVRQPFFASILLRKELIEDSSIPTAGVDKRGQIYYNPEFVEELSVQSLIFLLAHEVMHVCFQHASRVGTRDKRRANRAMDCVINELLIKEQVGDFIEKGQRWPNAENMTWEEVYALLPETPEGWAWGDENGGIGDDLLDRGAPMSESDVSEVEAQIKVAIAQAAQAAKMQGKLPAGIARLVDELINPPTPWYKHLEQYMNDLVKSSDVTWSRPNRRYISQGIYLPGASKEPKMGEVVVVIDTSGSIGAAELAHFGGHLNDILEQCVPEKVTVLYVDSEVSGVDEYTAEDFPVKLVPKGGGGTDMPKAWEWCDANGVEPDVMVMLTDGYTSWGTAPTFPLVVACTTKQVCPWGTTLQIGG